MTLQRMFCGSRLIADCELRPLKPARGEPFMSALQYETRGSGLRFTTGCIAWHKNPATAGGRRKDVRKGTFVPMGPGPRLLGVEGLAAVGAGGGPAREGGRGQGEHQGGGHEHGQLDERDVQDGKDTEVAGKG